MVKILDSLVSEGTIMCKVYGKSSFFCYQEINEHNEDKSAEVEVDQSTFMDLQAEIGELEKDSNELKKDIQTQEGKPSKENLTEQLASLEEERNDLQLQIKELKEKSCLSDTKEVKKHFNEIKVKHTELMANYLICLKKYKRVKDTIGDSVDDPVQFLKAIGVEEVPQLLFDKKS